MDGSDEFVLSEVELFSSKTPQSEREEAPPTPPPQASVCGGTLEIMSSGVYRCSSVL